MKLYLISQEQNRGYSTYDSAVVCAETEDQARNMDPSTGRPFPWDGQWWQTNIWCSGPEHVTVEHIGDARSGMEAGVVCSSFNEG